MLIDLFLYGYFPISHPANWGCAMFFAIAGPPMVAEGGAMDAWGIEVISFDHPDEAIDSDPVFIYLRYCARFHRRLLALCREENK